MELDANLVFCDVEAKLKDEILTWLAHCMRDKGYVKESFAKAILERERAFPTALEFEESAIAIPHTDVEYVDKPGVCIARLKNPVTFFSMENPAKEVPVRFIMMLAIKEAHAHLEVLQHVVEVFQQKGVLEELLHVDSSRFYSKLENIIGK